MIVAVELDDRGGIDAPTLVNAAVTFRARSPTRSGTPPRRRPRSNARRSCRG
ncbi:hypothetical protein AB5I41_29025 [Sphingomonas sp. MMS24-JH45]